SRRPDIAASWGSTPVLGGRGVLDVVPALVGAPGTEGGPPGGLRRPRGPPPGGQGARAGTAWQRCRVHFMRNLLSVVPRAAQETVAAVVRTIFSSPDHASAMAQLREVCSMLQAKFPDAAALLEHAAEDVLAHMHFPREHR